MRFVFGDFELDESTFELSFQGERVEVQPKVLKLLRHLIVNRGRTVSNPELLGVLWPNETVTPTSIRRAVCGARSALRESADCQSSIRTLRRRGHAFVAPVRVVPLAALAQAEGEKAALSAAELARDPFLGREAQLQLLESYLQDALCRKGRLVLLLGEAGIGKTRTLRELSPRLRALDVDVWTGHGVQADGVPGYYPWLQVLRQCLRDRPAEEIREAIGSGAADLIEALPDLRTELASQEGAPRIDRAQSRFRFFESVVKLLKRASERRAIALVFDDLHRADVSTLRLLCFLTEQLDGARILVLASLRSLHGQDARATDLFAQMARGADARAVQLERLTAAELATYLKLQIGEAPPPAVVDALHAQTAGNPLFWRQIVDVYRARARLGAAPDWSWFQGVSYVRDLRGAIERHLDTLSKPCWRLMEAAAVLGTEFSLGVLGRMQDAAPEAVMRMLSEAEVARVVQPVPDAIGMYAFTHALLREVLYENLETLVRARLHAAAGSAIEALRPGASGSELVELAHHYAAAAPVHDNGRALHYCLRTAATALEQLAYEDAARGFDRALALLDLDAPNPCLRLQILLDKADALTGAGDAAGARNAFMRAAAVARELAASDGLIRAALGVGRHPETGALDEERVALLTEALSSAPAADSRIPLLKVLLSKALTYSSENIRARALAREAIELARASGQAAVLGETLRHSSLILADLRYLSERRGLSDELLNLARAVGDQELLLQAQMTRYQTALEEGDPEALNAAIETLDTLSSEIRAPLFRWFARQFQAVRAMLEGRLTHAEELARSALEFARGAGAEVGEHVYIVQLYTIRMAQGRFHEVEATARLGVSRYPALAAWRAGAAILEAELGRVELAREELRHLMQQPFASPKDPLRYNALPSVAELCALVDERSAAGTLYEALLPLAAQHSIIAQGVATRGPIAKNLGMLAVCLGEFSRAEAHFEQALGMAERMRSPLLSAGVYYEMARLYARRRNAGDEKLAREFFSVTVSIADACGLGALGTKSRHAARELALPLKAVI
ncbi:MAG TPA: AAA family ATPase [Polyangiales bacterium]|nr:AAA family ATPase [Polyangiales bacterium]